VAEQQRMSNKERRARARSERKLQEEQAAKQRRRQGVRNGLVTVVVAGIVGAVVLQAMLGGPATLEEEMVVIGSEVEAGRDAAGCELFVDRTPLPEAAHFASGQQPAGELIWPEVRPTHSGPHAAQTHPVVSIASSQIDEGSSTHNLEHGAVMVWYDPDQVGSEDVEAMGSWATTLNENGFRSQGGGGVMVSPYEDPGISSGKALALRAWGVAKDCDAWNEDVANGFVIEHFGTHGIAPERNLSPYPQGVLSLTEDPGEEGGARDDRGGSGPDAPE
jgi:hypothetical protein